MLSFYRLLPFYWFPIGFAKPLIEYLIFIRMVFQCWVFHIWVNFRCAGCNIFTLSQVIMSSPFSDTWLCTVLSLTPFTRFVLPYFPIIINGNFSFAKWIDKDIALFVSMIVTLVQAFMIKEFTTKTFALWALFITSMSISQFTFVSLTMDFLVLVYQIVTV